MKITAKLDKRNKDAKLLPLKISISHKGETAYIPLDIYLLPSQWDDRAQLVVQHPNKGILNTAIGTRLVECRQAAYEYMKDRAGKFTTAAMIRDAVKGNEPVVFPIATLYERYLEGIGGSTHASYDQTYRKITQYVGPEDITLEDITVGWLEDWDSWMQRQGLSTNGRAVHHRNFRAFINWCINHDLTHNYPYRRYSIKTAPTAHRDLSLSEFRRFVCCPCEPYQEKYLRLFLLSFCLAGMNVKDLFYLKKTDYHGGRITYFRAKTGKRYDLIVHPLAAKLIAELQSTNVNSEYLLFPTDTYINYRHFAAHFNEALQKIGPTFEGRTEPLQPHITTYAARHTFASLSLSLGISKDTIAELMGHTRTVTDIYIRYDRRQADEALIKVIDSLRIQ